MYLISISIVESTFIKSASNTVTSPSNYLSLAELYVKIGAITPP